MSAPEAPNLPTASCHDDLGLGPSDSPGTEVYQGTDGANRGALQGNLAVVSDKSGEESYDSIDSEADTEDEEVEIDPKAMARQIRTLRQSLWDMQAQIARLEKKGKRASRKVQSERSGDNTSRSASSEMQSEVREQTEESQELANLKKRMEEFIQQQQRESALVKACAIEVEQRLVEERKELERKEAERAAQRAKLEEEARCRYELEVEARKKAEQVRIDAEMEARRTEMEARKKYEIEMKVRAEKEAQLAELKAKVHADALKAKAAIELDLVRDAELKAILDPKTSAQGKRKIREENNRREIHRRLELNAADLMFKYKRIRQASTLEGGAQVITTTFSRIECMGWKNFYKDHTDTDTSEQKPAMEVLLEKGNVFEPQTKFDLLSLSEEFFNFTPFPDRIRIHSAQDLRFLQDLAEKFGLVITENNELLVRSIVLIRPFKFLAHYEQRIRKNLENHPPSTPSSLQVFIDHCLLRRISYLASPSCTEVFFGDIWHLFKSGDFVFGQSGRQVYRVLSIASTCHRGLNTGANYFNPSRTASDGRETPIHILGVHLDFDGKQFGPIATEFIIKKYDGLKAIRSLEIYPANFDRNPEFWKKLTERGKKFIAAAGVQHMHYSGLALDTGDEIDSQVVLDFAEAFDSPDCQHWKPDIEMLVGASTLIPSVEACDGQQCCKQDIIVFDDQVEQQRNEEYMQRVLPPMWKDSKLPSAVVYPRTLEESKSTDNAFIDDEIILMSYRVFGFVLRTRKWAKLDIDCLRPIGTKRGHSAADKSPTQNPDQETSFDQLVLPRGHKDMVLSLITQHFRDKSSDRSGDDQVDIVRGKGKGLIMLLHGAPGVGKTSTAECVAELFRKPLFQITCAKPLNMHLKPPVTDHFELTTAH
ncbi:hypothetical protein QBC38DRAFT_270746 [Podospora fimiseda]|uniref:ATPase AAA-type core domain-containing protein n=1 Tax=Podospora fimiseda TaxID=252190 RepID=A0AAN7GUI2_9PEZI|nr:hypothetical protein QBC38DRAFT_270746 [Podospora fimiseda]